MRWILPSHPLSAAEWNIRCAGAMFILWECSTPFVYMRWFLYNFGWADTKVLHLQWANYVGVILHFQECSRDRYAGLHFRHIEAFVFWCSCRGLPLQCGALLPFATATIVRQGPSSASLPCSHVGGVLGGQRAPDAQPYPRRCDGLGTMVLPRDVPGPELPQRHVVL